MITSDDDFNDGNSIFQNTEPKALSELYSDVATKFNSYLDGLISLYQDCELPLSETKDIIDVFNNLLSTYEGAVNRYNTYMDIIESKIKFFIDIRNTNDISNLLCQQYIEFMSEDRLLLLDEPYFSYILDVLRNMSTQYDAKSYRFNLLMSHIEQYPNNISMVHKIFTEKLFSDYNPLESSFSNPYNELRSRSFRILIDNIMSRPNIIEYFTLDLKLLLLTIGPMEFELWDEWHINFHHKESSINKFNAVLSVISGQLFDSPNVYTLLNSMLNNSSLQERYTLLKSLVKKDPYTYSSSILPEVFI